MLWRWRCKYRIFPFLFFLALSRSSLLRTLHTTDGLLSSDSVGIICMGACCGCYATASFQTDKKYNTTFFLSNYLMNSKDKKKSIKKSRNLSQRGIFLRSRLQGQKKERFTLASSHPAFNLGTVMYWLWAMLSINSFPSFLKYVCTWHRCCNLQNKYAY